MIADADIQAWLETNAHTTPSIITPYVQSAVDKTLQYRVHAVREGLAGKSEISQGGTVSAMAKKPAALGQMSFTVGQDDQCLITLTLMEAGTQIGEYRFECPR